MCLSGPQQPSFEFQKSQLDEHAAGVQVRGPFYLLLAFHLPAVVLSLSSHASTVAFLRQKKTHKPQPISTCRIWIQHFQSPHTIKSQYITEAQPPLQHPWIKHGMKKRAVTKYYPIRGKVIYCTRHPYCFRSSLCPDQSYCKRCRRRENSPYWRQTQKYVSKVRGFLNWSLSECTLIFSAGLKPKYTAVINSWKCQHAWAVQRLEVHIRKPTELMPYDLFSLLFLVIYLEMTEWVKK